MITQVAFLVLLALASASGNPAAGKEWHWKSPKPLVTPRGAPRTEESRIVGGSEAIPHSWPHQVALFIDDGFFCGGSLISDKWVLTAAHCVYNAAKAVVVMGAHNIRIIEDSQVDMTSYYFVTHQYWDPYWLTNDIALIRLPERVAFNAYIQPVKLPSFNVSTSIIATPTGWGRTSDNGDGISDVLREVDVYTINNADCNAVYGIITEGNICIDGSGGRGTCNGDSGGPLNYNGVTLGITSFGSAGGCQLGYPNAFTRVHHYLDWIEAYTGITP
ncbi:brachyurin-like [Panulirus ornatus]|uniref:brachyurin-like n=1 Tax=Panulirus ornatus TaxID=150431 RepID=UPI003A897138